MATPYRSKLAIAANRLLGHLPGADGKNSRDAAKRQQEIRDLALRKKKGNKKGEK